MTCRDWLVGAAPGLPYLDMILESLGWEWLRDGLLWLADVQLLGYQCLQVTAACNSKLGCSSEYPEATWRETFSSHVWRPV